MYYVCTAQSTRYAIQEHRNDDDDDDDEAHAKIHIPHSLRASQREREQKNVMQGNYNRTNPGYIKRLTEDLFYFTLFCAANFFYACGFFDKMMQTILQPTKREKKADTMNHNIRYNFRINNYFSLFQSIRKFRNTFEI